MLIINNELSAAEYCIHFTLIIHCGDGEVVFVLDIVTASCRKITRSGIFRTNYSYLCMCRHMMINHTDLFLLCAVRLMNIRLKER